MTDYITVLFFSLVGGLLSLLGGVLLLRSKLAIEKYIPFILPFAAGALLGAAFFDLLPEAIEQTAEGAATRWVLVGILLFFLLEHFMHWFHHHSNNEDEHVKTSAPLIIIGDTVHNLIDGIAIGAAFLFGAPTGIITAFAVAAHEIPQEIGDFGLLLRAGYSKSRVLQINALSALATTIGALVTFWLGSNLNLPIGELLAITAGFFIYIAASDLIPDIHNGSKGKYGKLAAVILLLGVLVVAVVTQVVHEAIDDHGQDVEISEPHAHE